MKSARGAPDDREKGIAQMLEGSTAYRTLGGQSYRTAMLSGLLEAYVKRGQMDEGVKVLTEALAIVENRRER